MRCINARINYSYRNSRAGETGGRLQIELADNGRGGLYYIVAGHLRPVVIHHGASGQAIQNRRGRLGEVGDSRAGELRETESAITLKTLNVTVCGDAGVKRKS